MKRSLAILAILFATLGSSAALADGTRSCPDLVILPDGRECTLTGVSQTGSCYYSCS
jgi:hypothetical protein